MQLNGKEYQFKYIPAKLFVSTMKILREVDAHRQALLSFDTPIEELEGHSEKFQELWPKFCDMAFEGEKPVDISLGDVVEVVKSFFGQQIGSATKPTSASSTSRDLKTKTANK